MIPLSHCRIFFCCYSAGHGRRDALPHYTSGRRDALPHYRIGRRDALPHDAAGLFEALAQPLQVGDGLLADVAEDVHVYDRADGSALSSVGYLAGGAVIVVAQVLEMGADLVGHLEAVQGRVRGEKAAVVSGDVKAGVGSKLNDRTCWRRTSGWKSGLDSTAICRGTGYRGMGEKPSGLNIQHQPPPTTIQSREGARGGKALASRVG